MKHVNCNDRERILREADPAELGALEAHAETCQDCRAELEVWNEISATAGVLHREWESPELWPRIRQSLAEEMAAGRARQNDEWAVPALWHGWGRGWQMVVATMALAVLSLAGTLLIISTGNPPEPPDTTTATAPASGAPAGDQRLLTEQALQQIEEDEARYLRSIDRLAQLAALRLENASTPLMANYREKLMVLDAAIAELQAAAGHNQFNAHLRTELLSIYQQKARTLRAVMQAP
ncbi:MAG TPA: hypothetical protein VGA40_01255 [Candidatus Acidoferrales bacterium]